MKIEKRSILVFVILLIALNIINFVIMMSITGGVVAQGISTLCFNHPPDSTVIPDQTATVGTLFTYQVLATDIDSSSNLTYYDNTSLFNIDSATGLISFTPQSADVGTPSIKITVGDNSTCSNNNTSVTFLLTISEAGAPPPAAPPLGGGGAVSLPGKAVPSPPITSFKVSEEIIKVVLKPSQKIEKKVMVTDTGNTTLKMRVYNPLSKLIFLSPEKFDLQPNEKKELKLLFNFRQDALPGVYSRMITLLGTSNLSVVSHYITLVVEVESERVFFDASLDLAKKTLSSGEDLKATITLFNLRKIAPGEVALIYTVSDLNGTIVTELKENVTVEDQITFSKVIDLPPDLPTGRYLLALKIVSIDSFATATELFAIEGTLPPVVEKPVTPPSISIMFTVIILLVLASLVMIYLVWGKLRKNKRMSVPKTLVKAVTKQEVQRLEHKLSLLKESHQKGYIKEETYRKAKENLGRILKEKR